MGYDDGTQNFTMKKCDILTFKRPVLGVFSISKLKVILKEQKSSDEIAMVVSRRFASFYILNNENCVVYNNIFHKNEFYHHLGC